MRVLLVPVLPDQWLGRLESPSSEQEKLAVDLAPATGGRVVLLPGVHTIGRNILNPPSVDASREAFVIVVPAGEDGIVTIQRTGNSAVNVTSLPDPPSDAFGGVHADTRTAAAAVRHVQAHSENLPRDKAATLHRGDIIRWPFFPLEVEFEDDSSSNLQQTKSVGLRSKLTVAAEAPASSSSSSPSGGSRGGHSETAHVGAKRPREPDAPQPGAHEAVTDLARASAVAARLKQARAANLISAQPAAATESEPGKQAPVSTSPSPRQPSSDVGAQALTSQGADADPSGQPPAVSSAGARSTSASDDQLHHLSRHHMLLMPLLSIGRDFGVSPSTSASELAAALKAWASSGAADAAPAAADGEGAQTTLHVVVVAEEISIKAAALATSAKGSGAAVNSASSSAPSEFWPVNTVADTIRTAVNRANARSGAVTIGSNGASVIAAMQVNVVAGSLVHPRTDPMTKAAISGAIQLDTADVAGGGGVCATAIRANWRLRGTGSYDTLTSALHAAVGPQLDAAAQSQHRVGEIGKCYAIGLRDATSQPALSSSSLAGSAFAASEGVTHVIQAVCPAVFKNRPNVLTDAAADADVRNSLRTCYRNLLATFSSLVAERIPRRKPTAAPSVAAANGADADIVIDSDDDDHAINTRPLSASASSGKPTNAYAMLMGGARDAATAKRAALQAAAATAAVAVAAPTAAAPRADMTHHTRRTEDSRVDTAIGGGAKAQAAVSSLGAESATSAASSASGANIGSTSSSHSGTSGSSTSYLIQQQQQHRQRPPREAFASNNLSSLHEYLSHPERYPSVVLYYDDEFVAVRDKYPKAAIHVLLLPRPSFLKAANPSDLRRHHLPQLQRMQEVAQLVTDKAIQQYKAAHPDHTLVAGGGGVAGGRGKPGVWWGFHGSPSLQPLHLHIVSDDLAGEFMKTRKHYASFASPTFFVRLSSVIETLKYNDDLGINKSQMEAILRSDGNPRCHRCGATDITPLWSFVQHLAACEVPVQTRR